MKTSLLIVLTILCSQSLWAKPARAARENRVCANDIRSEAERRRPGVRVVDVQISMSSGYNDHLSIQTHRALYEDGQSVQIDIFYNIALTAERACTFENPDYSGE